MSQYTLSTLIIWSDDKKRILIKIFVSNGCTLAVFMPLWNWFNVSRRINFKPRWWLIIHLLSYVHFPCAMLHMAVVKLVNKYWNPVSLSIFYNYLSYFNLGGGVPRFFWLNILYKKRNFQTFWSICYSGGCNIGHWNHSSPFTQVVTERWLMNQGLHTTFFSTCGCGQITSAFFTFLRWSRCNWLLG